MKKGLGKGLGALIASAETEDTGVIELNINDIEPNTEQPRKSFDDEKLEQLAESIKKHGIIQPLIVQRDGNTYKIVTGERRWRAARLAGVKVVPVIIRELSGREVMEVALIENIQREDLNPIEEAEAYKKLIDDYGMTQEEIAVTVGKSRPAVANSLRLLSLADSIKNMLISGDISSGHARALISIADPGLQTKAAATIVEKGLNVRDTELLVKRIGKDNKEKQKRKKETFDAEYKAIEDRFREVFGTKVKIINRKNSGKILIEYYSPEDLDRIINIVEKINVSRET
ncbi:MAG: ParB/RepB/Spo0J family partition protein [Acetivibrionales bacterium]|jgi:ParB family chromosome partitioning protein